MAKSEVVQFIAVNREEERMPQFRNFYRCERCLRRWEDVWSATCDDKCPQCNQATSPYRSEDADDEEITEPQKVLAIRALNDAFRKSFLGGRVMRTSGVAALPDVMQERVFNAIKSFEGFSPDNDPHGERDMAFVEVDGETYIAKIEYYDTDQRFLSDDPSDPKITRRVMTIMMAQEY